VTKNETESLMEDAIGNKISDYLIKPVNPNQLLLVCKKVLESKRIKGDQISRDYIQEFNRMSAALFDNPDWKEWINLYSKMTNWDLDVSEHRELGLMQTISDQKRESNAEFCKFVEKNYEGWVNAEEGDDAPTLSHQIMDKYVFPELDSHKSVFLFVVDCMRLDQWLVMEPFLNPYFRMTKDYYYSLLPTATPYSRNAIFAGLFPADIEKHYPELWKGSDDENSRNMNEKELLTKLL